MQFTRTIFEPAGLMYKISQNEERVQGTIDLKNRIINEWFR